MKRSNLKLGSVLFQFRLKMSLGKWRRQVTISILPNPLFVILPATSKRDGPILRRVISNISKKEANLPLFNRNRLVLKSGRPRDLREPRNIPLLKKILWNLRTMYRSGIEQPARATGCIILTSWTLKREDNRSNCK
jgi:hypothetical protein